MKTYRLTTPHMCGSDVKAIQRGLNAKHFGPVVVDGDYGPASAAAVKRAKYALGYPDKAVNTLAGPTFLGFLTGRKRPAAYVVRAKARAKKVAAAKTLGAKALANLSSKIGTKESPAGSNRCWATAWYGFVGPWCAMSVTWAYVTAGSKAFARGSRWAYVPAMLGDALAQRNGLSITHDPRPGDPVLFDWNQDGTPDHVGLFVKWIDRGRGILQTVEGNTSDGNDSNGGQVMRRTRYMSNVRAFVRVAK